MADVNLYRGGTPDLKGWFRRGDWPEFMPPFTGPMMPATPPYNSHADAAHGQGYLNLHFPLVPHIMDTAAHGWMGLALRKLATAGDIIYTNWIPLRSYVTTFHWEVTKFDESLTGVYLKPVAKRVKFNFSTKEFDVEDNTAFDTIINTAGITGFPIGKPETDDKVYAFVENTDLMCTFGHNIPKRNEDTGKPEEGLDDYFGAVVLGYEVSGEEELIAKIWNGFFAIYSSCKCFTFEGASQL